MAISQEASPTAKRSQGPGWALAGLLAVAAVGHFAKPQFFEPLIPEALPGRPRDWVLGSGVGEAATAVLVALRPTRRLGGLVAALLFVAVFPGNLTMAWDAWQTRAEQPGNAAIALLRLPLQIPLVWWALRVRRNAS